MAVGKVQLGIIDLGIVGTHQTFLLGHQRFLCVVLLLGDYALLVEIGIALQIAPRIFEVCLVLELCRFSLRDLHFVRSRVDQREFIAFADVLSFAEIHLHQLAIHTTVNSHRVIGLNIPQSLEVNGHVTLLHGSN